MQTDLSFCRWPRRHFTDSVGLLLGVRVVDAHHPESGNKTSTVSLDWRWEAHELQGLFNNRMFPTLLWFIYFHIIACKYCKMDTSGLRSNFSHQKVCAKMLISQKQPCVTSQRALMPLTGKWQHTHLCPLRLPSFCFLFFFQQGTKAI